jgi:cob(I)alamin adenosyltransferase
MVKIYTKNGDTGKTNLIKQSGLSKSDNIFETLGTLDELNAALAFCNLNEIQQDLFVAGSILSGAPAVQNPEEYFEVRVRKLETEIDELDEKMPKLTNFILPGGTDTAKFLHLARAICRRLERSFVRFDPGSIQTPPALKKFINRLSDYLFVKARYENHKHKVADVIWKRL